MNVLVLKDQALVCPRSVAAVSSLLASALSPNRYAVRGVEASELAGPWQKSTSLLVLPPASTTTAPAPARCVLRAAALPPAVLSSIEAFCVGGGRVWAFGTPQPPSPSPSWWAPPPAAAAATAGEPQPRPRVASLVVQGAGGPPLGAPDAAELAWWALDAALPADFAPHITAQPGGHTLACSRAVGGKGGRAVFWAVPPPPLAALPTAAAVHTLQWLGLRVEGGEDGAGGVAPPPLAPTPLHLMSAQEGAVRGVLRRFHADAVPGTTFSLDDPPLRFVDGERADRGTQHNDGGGGNDGAQEVRFHLGEHPDGLGFNPRLYFAHLRTGSLGRVVLHGDVVGSTQQLLDGHWGFTCKLPSGLVHTALAQTKGRGRGANVWLSPKGQLMFSLVLHHAVDAAPVTLMQYVVALAVVEGIKACAGCADLPVFVKWPNDVLVREGSGELAKVGGILITSTVDARRFVLVIGVGLNLNNDLPTTSVNGAIRGHNQKHGTRIEPLQLETTLAAILSQLESVLFVLNTRGFFPDLAARYVRSWVHDGQVVRLADKDGEFKLVGLDEDGYLTAVNVDNGQRVSLDADGNSFDMAQNLISRKV